jgi:hypothetical protein
MVQLLSCNSKHFFFIPHSEPSPAHRKAHNPDLILLVDSRNDWPVADVISAGPAIGNHNMIYKLGVH